MKALQTESYSKVDDLPWINEIAPWIFFLYFMFLFFSSMCLNQKDKKETNGYGNKEVAKRNTVEKTQKIKWESSYGM